MAFFVVGRQPAHHRDRGLFIWLVAFDKLKASRQRWVFFKILFVLGPSRRRERAQLPARQCRLEQVCGVAATLWSARANQGVSLVDEHDDRLGRPLNLLDHRFEPVFEFTFDAGTPLAGAPNPAPGCRRRAIGAAPLWRRYAARFLRPAPFCPCQPHRR
jgi:hypothetical protein